MGKLQERVREWWTSNPMTYDWDKTVKSSQGTREFFDEIDNRFYNASFFAQENGAELFSKLIDYKALAGKKVLEIGCGAGAITARLAKCGAQVTAVDLTPTAVELTQARFRLNNLKGDILQMDAESLEFEDNTFDFVWSWGVIHHSENTERIVSQIYRVLKPGGRAAIMVYNRNSIHFWLYLMFFRGVLCGNLFVRSPNEICNRYSDGFIAKYYTLKAFGSILKENKFSQVETRIYGQKVEVYPIFKSIRAALIKLMPEAVTNWLVYNFGCFLYLTALKPCK